MKIEQYTVNVLKNFSVINPTIIINAGSVLETISISKTIKATATVPTVFPRRFALYNLNKFIAALSLFDDPDVEFGENAIVVTDGQRTVHITYSDESVVTKMPDKEPVLPSVDVTTTVTTDQLKEIEKALGILDVPEIVISGRGGKIYLEARNTTNDLDYYSIVLGDTDQTFSAVYKKEYMKFLPGTYKVEISSKKASKLYNDDVEYFIALATHSKF